MRRVEVQLRGRHDPHPQPQHAQRRRQGRRRRRGRCARCPRRPAAPLAVIAAAGLCSQGARHGRESAAAARLAVRSGAHGAAASGRGAGGSQRRAIRDGDCGQHGGTGIATEGGRRAAAGSAAGRAGGSTHHAIRRPTTQLAHLGTSADAIPPLRHILPCRSGCRPCRRQAALASCGACRRRRPCSARRQGCPPAASAETSPAGLLAGLVAAA